MGAGYLTKYLSAPLYRRHWPYTRRPMRTWVQCYARANGRQTTAMYT